MYRQIFTPSEQNSSIPIPRKIVREKVEIIAFPVSDTNESGKQDTIQEKQKRRNKLLDKYLIDLSGFKFNRDEANDYD
jgi:hypothetical protein